MKKYKYLQDAVLAVENCGVIYMKDAEGKAHAGFPEKGYQKYADVFVGLGFKVARIGKQFLSFPQNQGHTMNFKVHVSVVYLYIFFRTN